MKRYITRHGQIAKPEELSPEVAAEFREGEKPLSPLGREQARRLGEKLKELGFCGKIISSPYMRTLETADIIADITGTDIIPFAPFREIFREPDMEHYHGLTLDEMRASFKNIAPDAVLSDKWWCDSDGKEYCETQKDVDLRVAKGYEEIDKIYPDIELLIVGHAASAAALLKYFNICEKAKEKIFDIRAFQRTTLFNCSLSAYDPSDPDFCPIYCDTSHIPYELTTANFASRETWDTNYFASAYESEIELPEGFGNAVGKRILHIGDTLSKHFPFYRKLIELTKPDVIIHTGDVVDEVKVGRIPEVYYEYRSKLKVILGIMKDSGARIIIVPGNNDVPELIRELAPEAEVCPHDTAIELYGIPCRIGHSPVSMHHDKKWSFYGHTLRYDDWDERDNAKGENCRFNAIRGPYVCTVEDGQFYRFATPDDF